MDTTTFDAHGVTFTVSSDDADVVGVFDDLLIDLAVDPSDAGLSDADPSEADRPAADPAVAATSSSEPPRAGHPIRYTVDAADIGSDTDRGNDREHRWFRVAADGEVVYASLLDGSLVSHLLMDVNARAAAACRRYGAVPLHAGSVAGIDGAIVLPGASHSGKTTLTTALAASGHRFLADEVSRLDPDRLTIAPYGKPVALRSASVELLAPSIARLRRPGSPFEADERFVPPSELGPSDDGATAVSAISVATDPIEVCGVVFPRYDPDGSDRFSPLSPAATLERLMQCTLGTASTTVGADVFRALERLVRVAPGHELIYTDLTVAIQALAPLTGDPVGYPPTGKSGSVPLKRGSDGPPGPPTTPAS